MTRDRFVARCIAGAALAVVGCAGDGEMDGDPRLLQQASATASFDGGVADAGPALPFAAEVTASGTGCPPGTWSARLAEDGTVTATFRGYDVSIAPDAGSSFRDCTVSVQARSARPTAYLIESARFDGYAFLEPGVSAVATLAWDLTGFVPPRPFRVEVAGPYDATFFVQAPSRVVTADPVYTPCGTTRTLNVVTRAGLRRVAGAGSGSLNPISVDQDGAPQLRFRVVGRACIPPGL